MLMAIHDHRFINQFSSSIKSKEEGIYYSDSCSTASHPCDRILAKMKKCIYQIILTLSKVAFD
jgi:hypothetical protein